jgi:5,10-methylenetetrahydromethanopterin reductase
MRYGVTLQGVDHPGEFGEIARRIERLGFDDLWITDSSLHAGEVYVYATLALEATSTLRVGTAVTNPLTRHPAITANAAATLARLASGRFVCGIGTGDSPLGEIGLRPAKVDTLVATVATMRRLWAGESLTGQVGRHEYRDARLTEAVPDLPVHFAASGPRTLAAAGEHADGAIVLAGLFPEGLAFALEHLQRGRRRYPRKAFTTTFFLYGSIRDDEARALEEARTIAAWFPKVSPAYAGLAGMSDQLIESVRAAYRGGEFQRAGAAARLIDDRFVRKLAFAGTPDAAAAKLGWLSGTGIDAVSIFPLGSDRFATIEAFAKLAGLGAEVTA